MQRWTLKTLTYEGCTVTVHRPELTATERAKRERTLQDAISLTLRGYIERKGK